MIRRLRTFTLWTGTLLSLLIAAAFVVSAWWNLWVGPWGGIILIHAGSIEYRYPAGVSPAGYNSHKQGLLNALVGRRWGKNAISVPLIYPFAAVAISTLLVWRFWPKPVKPGHCRCGYDLTGNTSGVCPECGVEVQA